MIEEDDDTPAPFVRIRQHRKLFGRTTDNTSFEAACQGKLAFPTAAGAAKALKHKTDINGRRVYRCRHCHQFHIGNQPPSKHKRRDD